MWLDQFIYGRFKLHLERFERAQELTRDCRTLLGGHFERRVLHLLHLGHSGFACLHLTLDMLEIFLNCSTAILATRALVETQKNALKAARAELVGGRRRPRRSH